MSEKVEINFFWRIIGLRQTPTALSQDQHLLWCGSVLLSLVAVLYHLKQWRNWGGSRSANRPSWHPKCTTGPHL